MVPDFDTFSSSGLTTNFTAISDLSHITNLTLATSHSRIHFPETYSVDADNEDYDSNIVLGDCFVSVNSAELDSTFNATANLTLENADGHCGDNIIYYSPDFHTSADSIRSQDSKCLICTQIQKSNGFITKFQISHFSSYAIGSNTRLDIYDNYEGSFAPEGGDIIFYANYTNRTSGLDILGAECNISFDSDPTQYTMTDNSNNYNFTRNFSSSGSHIFHVNCSKSGSGYNTLNASDDVDVGYVGGVPEFSMATLGLALVILLAGLFVIRWKK